MDPDTYNRLEQILEWYLLIVVIVTGSFPVLYLRSRWRKYREGRAIMFLAFGIFLAWGLTYLLSRLDPEWFFENIWTVFWVQFGILTYTLAAGVYLTFALWYAQRKDTPGHSLGQENEEVTTNGNSKPE